MNGKMKVLIALVSIVGISAIALYAVPIMAYQNGTLDQDRLRDCSRNRERDHECLCLQNENCACENVDCSQNRYGYQFRHEECAENMSSLQMGIGMMEAINNNCYRNRERHRMGQ